MVLLTILKQIKLEEKEMRILILGLDNSGKTSIVKQLLGEDVTTISPTLGFDIKTFEFGENTLNLWDVGGQKTIRHYWRNYYDKTDGLIFVVDSADTKRLNECKSQLDEILTQEKLSGATLLIFANKIDLKSSMSVEDIAEELDIDSIENRRCQVQGCCALEGDGILEGITWLVSDIHDRIFL